MQKLKNRRKKGFTLIEMVVVVAIVVIIAAIAIPQALKAINKSKASTDIANARTYAGEIMTKVADGTITFEATKDSSNKAAAEKLTKDTPKGFDTTPQKPKLVKGEFYYQFIKDDKGNDTVQISVVEEKGTAGETKVIYPEVHKESEYYKYVSQKEEPEKTTP